MNLSINNLSLKQTYLILLSLLLVHVLMAYTTNNLYMDEIYVFQDSIESVKVLTSIITLIIAGIAPLFTIGSFFIVLMVTAMIQVIKSLDYKKEILKIATFSYLPLFIGTLINFILTLILGYSEKGYITFAGVANKSEGFISELLIQLSPFQIISYIMLAFLYKSYYQKSIITFYIIFLVFAIFSIMNLVVK